jgi:hypothetical protein
MITVRNTSSCLGQQPVTMPPTRWSKYPDPARPMITPGQPGALGLRLSGVTPRARVALRLTQWRATGWAIRCRPGPARNHDRDNTEPSSSARASSSPSATHKETGPGSGPVGSSRRARPMKRKLLNRVAGTVRGLTRPCQGDESESFQVQ